MSAKILIMGGSYGMAAVTAELGNEKQVIIASKNNANLSLRIS